MKTFLFSILLIFCSFSLIGNILEVGENKSFNTISSAIESSRPFDTILVYPKIYTEGKTLLIEHPLYLKASEKNTVILDGKEQHGLIFIHSDSVTIDGFVIKNVGTSYIEDRAAILVDQSKYCRIINNILENTFFGIYFKKSFSCEISDNSISGKAVKEFSSANAIHLWYCKKMKVSGNQIRGHRDGIYLEFVDSSLIENNLSENNLRYGLHFMFSNNDVYLHNTFKNNGAGVAVMFSHYIDMIENHFVENMGSASYGLLLKEIYDGNILRNEFRENTIGLYGEGANRLKISFNTFENNGWALKILGSSLDNYFIQNNFFGNSFNLSTNARRNQNTFRQNYWDDYSGYDLNHDGIGDVPFRPVGIFSYLVTKIDASMILMRSPIIEILNYAENMMPALTPSDLTDPEPAMKPNK